MFTNLTENMEVRSFGSGNARIIIFRHTKAQKTWRTWEQIPNTQIILIGGPNAKRELAHIFQTISRPRFTDLMPDGISAGTHTKIRAWLGLPADRGRPKKKKPPISN